MLCRIPLIPLIVGLRYQYPRQQNQKRAIGDAQRMRHAVQLAAHNNYGERIKTLFYQR